jgi:DNA repair protein RecN (Recombination protein N)
LAAVEDRRAELSALTRLHGPDVDAVLAWAAEAAARLEQLEVSDDRLVELTEQVARLDDELSALAAVVTRHRQASAEHLSAAIGRELAGLAMPQARVDVKVMPGVRGRHGADEVEFALVPHAGAPARPLGRGASGGELSRVMLALEVVLADVGEAATLVFDEVDAGVGGRAAVEVGRRLARLARTHQVICVTHLPQVAAFADAHVRVAKSGDGSVTVTDVAVLDDTDRVIELSRMLGGLAESDLAQGHARELLDLAAAERSAVPAQSPTRSHPETPQTPRSRRKAPAAA